MHWLLAFPRLALLAGLNLIPATAAEITGLILTWRNDPTTTQIIDWHQPTPEPLLFSYRIEGAADWTRITPEPARSFPYTDRWIHRVELTGLAADSRHEFRIGDGPVRVFQTLPATLAKPLRFVIGGDNMHEREKFARMNRIAAALDQAFIVWGGDLAYEDGQEAKVARMTTYVETLHETLVAPDGRIIPVVVGIGNHEVRGGYYWNSPHGHDWPANDEAREEIAPYFYALWAFPGHPGYGVLDLGDYASLLMLDTDHTGPVAGAQTVWLAAALATRPDRPHLLPIYHVPAYPSHRGFEGQVSVRVREHWVPLFEAAGVRVAFEHHDHLYKRTAPLRGGQAHPDGVTYVGDGAWGVAVREPAPDRDYLARASAVNHAILATMHPDYLELTAVDADGTVFDRFTIPARHTPATE